MNNLLKKMDEWAARAIKFIRPAKHNSPNVLIDNVHLKERQTLENNKIPQTKIMITPVQYYITRTGQLMRKKIIHKISKEQ